MLKRICPMCNDEKEFKWKSQYESAMKNSGVCGKCRYENFGKNRKIPEHEEQKIIQLAKLGKRCIDIAEETSHSYITIKRVMSENNLYTPEFTKGKIEYLENGNVICYRCKKEVSAKELSNMKDGRKHSYCKKCKNKWEIGYLNSDIKRIFAGLIKGIKSRSLNKGLVVTITKEEMEEKFKQQDGLCFYTKEKLDWMRGNGLTRQSMSIDRIIPEKGYTKENTVLCLHIINQCKNNLSLEELEKWIPQWYERLKNENKIP